MYQLVSAGIRADAVVRRDVEWTKLLDRCGRNVECIEEIMLIGMCSTLNGRREAINRVADVFRIGSKDSAVDRSGLIDSDIDLLRLFCDDRSN